MDDNMALLDRVEEIVAALKETAEGGYCLFGIGCGVLANPNLLRLSAELIESQAAQIANLTAERDEAVEDIPHNCHTCKYRPVEITGGVGVCRMGCTVSSISIEHAERCHWEWRGSQGDGEGAE